MTPVEPPAKKQKSAEDWADHKMNISEAVMKADEGKNLSEIADSSIEVIQGIGPKSEAILEGMGIKTVSPVSLKSEVKERITLFI